WLRDRTRRPPWDLVAILGLIGLAQVATPMGWDIFALSRRNLTVSRDWLQVTEWLPPWSPTVLHAMLLFWLVLGMAVLLLFR
ncbi:MAG: hypothetical protein GTO03_04305, partial [Planctomycetales bacterium]|nr:hypothetical protein [Planctomycetales bacterium]